MEYVDIVFAKMEDPMVYDFVEVEYEGRSVAVGEWDLEALGKIEN